LNGDYIDDICKQYALNFAATLINNAAPMTNGSSAPPPPGTTTYYETPNPFNDWLTSKEPGLVKITPRVAYMNACGYMYTVYSRKPVIDVNALDATLDVMTDMLFHTYDRDDIRAAFPYLLEGAKMGRILFNLKQDPKFCYD